MKAPSFWESRGLISTLLLPDAWLVGVAATLRQKWARPTRVEKPVLCVGNLVAGGAGKTPVVLEFARLLRQRGRRPFALARGYGGSLHGPVRVDPLTHTAAQIGDEALMLADTLPTIVSHHRVKAAKLAVQSGADSLLMDDGFQNPSLHKDAHLLVIDGTYGLGNGRVLPAGPLREPAALGLARADAIVLIGEAKANALSAVLAAFRKPVFRAMLHPANGDVFRDRACIAFAGIGRPEKFFGTLEQCGAKIVERFSFADHRPYREDEISRMRKTAAMHGAILVTTRKDYVRIPSSLRHGIQVLDVVLRFEDEAGVEAWLKTVTHG